MDDLGCAVGRARRRSRRSGSPRTGRRAGARRARPGPGAGPGSACAGRSPRAPARPARGPARERLDLDEDERRARPARRCRAPRSACGRCARAWRMPLRAQPAGGGILAGPARCPCVHPSCAQCSRRPAHGWRARVCRICATDPCRFATRLGAVDRIGADPRGRSRRLPRVRRRPPAVAHRARHSPGHSRSSASRPCPSTPRSTSTAGCPSFSVVGLPDAAVRESRERVRAAIVNSGLRLPAAADHGQPRARRSAQGRPGLRPGDRRRDPGRLRAAAGAACSRGWALAGELGARRRRAADPRRPGDGRGGAAQAAPRESPSPGANAAEAALVPDLEVAPIDALGELAALAEGDAPRRAGRAAGGRAGADPDEPDLARSARTAGPAGALEVAAAGATA